MSTKLKAQALALTIFIILASLGVVIVLLMPINQQVIKVRKILNTFQALSNAETGIEVSNLYAIKGDRLNGYSFQILPPELYPQSRCKIFVDIMDERMCKDNFDCGSRDKIPPGYCHTIKINKTADESINSLIYYAEFRSRDDYQIYPYTKVISTGRLKNVERVLDFDFWPF